MIRVCSFPGCDTLTLGEYCVAHEAPAEARAWPRGRPFAHATATLDADLALRRELAIEPFAGRTLTSPTFAASPAE